ncbi:MAG TPA: 5'-3' exonuclease H3TH domain-containing protein, partial [Candidatus Bathyarchaeia archaeon]|nr:5'-3' exonuclease H3TH domain-containing protein [Candidatus Bathyarchaeia archaeon]
MTTKKKLILIDSNALIHRAYHALPPLTTKKGEIVNAVYGYTSVLLNVLAKFKPDYIVATFDLKEPTFRHKEYKDYKATRVKGPDDLYAQIPRVKEIVEAFNIPIAEKEGYEADDLIATFARKTEKLHPDVEVTVVTGDLDTLQLVDDKVKIFALRRGMSDSVIYDERAIFERYGLKPDQMIDYKGLRGDPSDNLPGVKGVGEKTASELLKKYGTLENIYKNLSDIKEGVRKKLEKDKLQAYFSKRLSRLIDNVPVKFDLEKAKAEDFSRVKIINLLRELEFFSLLRRLPGYEEHIKSVEKEKKEKPGEAGEIKWKRIYSADQLDVKNAVSVVVDAGVDGILKGIAMSPDPQTAYCLSGADQKLKNILSDEKIEKIGYDLKKDWRILAENKIFFRGLSFDVQLAAYLLHSGSNLSWQDLVMQELGVMIEKEDKKAGQGALFFPEGTLLGAQDKEEVEKICRKAALNFALKEKLAEELERISREQMAEGKEKTIKSLFENLEMPLVPILAEMERVGIRINKLVLRGISEKLDRRVEKLGKEIQKLAGARFN